jgi:hypothetical protein
MLHVWETLEKRRRFGKSCPVAKTDLSFRRTFPNFRPQKTKQQHCPTFASLHTGLLKTFHFGRTFEDISAGLLLGTTSLLASKQGNRMTVTSRLIFKSIIQV